MKKYILLLSLLCPVIGLAQQYSVNWHKISSGGGTSAGATYVITGTIGQLDASVAMTGGSYSLTGGFWGLISVVQTAGVPNLVITPTGPNSVQILWPNTGSYTLQQNSDLTTTNWTTSGYSITTANGTNSITVTPPVGNLFFRLKK